MDAQKELADWLSCRKCALGERAKLHVLGRGVLPAQVLFIGEAPGKSEDVLGEAFVGRAGRLLDKAVAVANKKGVPVYFTNLVACRPCDRIGAPNRQPLGLEVLSCLPRLQKTIELSGAHGIVVCGRLAQVVFARYLPGPGLPNPIRLEIPQPAWILRRGGEASADWPDYVCKLVSFFERVTT
jgi:DNA polymerase